MTTKRFIINNDMTLDNKVETYELSCIVDNSNKTFYFIVDSIANVESFVERLNELNEENKELKKQMNRLYNYFMDWHSDEMGGNQFSEMWDYVKEDEDWEL